MVSCILFTSTCSILCGSSTPAAALGTDAQSLIGWLAVSSADHPPQRRRCEPREAFAAANLREPLGCPHPPRPPKKLPTTRSEVPYPVYPFLHSPPPPA